VSDPRIQPGVIARLISQAVLALPGVARAAAVSSPGTHEPGVAVRVTEAGISAVCHLVAAPDARLPQLGAAVQIVAAGAAAIAGATLNVVDVRFEDVEDIRG
jgi:hypothetical protein